MSATASQQYALSTACYFFPPRWEATVVLLPSMNWAFTVCRCLLPRRCLSKSDSDVQLALQILQFHLEAGLCSMSTSCSSFFSYSSASSNPLSPWISWLSLHRATVFSWCLLPFRWLFRSNSPEHLTWQMLQFQAIGLCCRPWLASAVAILFGSAASLAHPNCATFDWCWKPAQCSSNETSLYVFTWQRAQIHFSDDLFLFDVEVSAVLYLFNPENVFLGSLACLMTS